MKTIGKRTTKLTTEAKAQKIYYDLPLERKEVLYSLLGKIACGEIKNFYSTKVYKALTKDLTYNQKAVISYICKKESVKTAFENMEGLVLAEE